MRSFFCADGKVDLIVILQTAERCAGHRAGNVRALYLYMCVDHAIQVAAEIEQDRVRVSPGRILKLADTGVDPCSNLHADAGVQLY